MSKHPQKSEKSQPSAVGNSEKDAETVLVGQGDTEMDFEALLAEARDEKHSTAETELECQALTSRLRNLDEVRLLADQVSTDPPSSENRKIGSLELLERIGRGGMGEVWRARHTKLGKIQAVKLLHAHRANEPQLTARFQKEMEVIGRLEHPNIVTAQHADEEDGISYLVMDYIEGETLSDLTKRYHAEEESVPIGLACELVRQAALGLHYAHGRGVVHRDVKPGNMMVDGHGIVRILDLGLARIASAESGFSEGEDLTAESQVLGTPDYMAPEQFRNSKGVDARCDVYALGATLYYLLTGQTCFPCDQSTSLMDKAVRILSESPPNVREIRREVPEELSDLITRCLAKTPEERPSSAEELVQALEQWARVSPDETISESTVSESPSPVTSSAGVFDGRSSLRRRLLLCGGLLLPILLLGGLIYKLQLPDGGELLVELHDPRAQLQIVAVQEDKSKTLTFEQNGEGAFQLTTGPWQLSLSGLDADQFELSEQSIVIAKGDTKRVTITVRSPEAVAADKTKQSQSAVAKSAPDLPRNKTTPREVSSEIDWAPQDASGNLSGIVQQPARLSPGFETGMHLIRTPIGISDQWSAARFHFDVAPDGQSWAYSTGKEILIRDLATNEVQAIAVGANRVNWNNVAFSPDGTLFATIDATHGSTGIQIRDRSGRLKASWDYVQTFDISPWRPCQMKWMPDGEHLLVWNSHAAVVFRSDGHPVHRIQYDQQEFEYPVGWHSHFAFNPTCAPGCWTVAVHPDSTEVWFVFGNGTIQNWDLERNMMTEVTRFKPSSSSSTGVKWNTDGERLLVWCSGGEDGSKPIAQILSRQGEVLQSASRDRWGLADWSPDGRSIVTDKGQILDENLKLLKELDLEEPEDSPFSGAARIPFWKTPSQVVFVYGDDARMDRSGIVRRLRLSGAEVPTPYSPQPLGVVGATFTPKGSLATVHQSNRGKAEVFEWTATGDAVRSLTPDSINIFEGAGEECWSQAGTRLTFVGPAQKSRLVPGDAAVEIRGEVAANEYPFALVISPNQKYVSYSKISTGELIVEDAQGAIVGRFAGGGYHCSSHWSPDSRWLVWRSQEETGGWLNIVDMSTDNLQPQRVPVSPEFTSGSLAISPDSRFLAYLTNTESEGKTSLTLVVRNLAKEEQTSETVQWNRHHSLDPIWSQNSTHVFAGQMFSVSENGRMTPVADMNILNQMCLACFRNDESIVVSGTEQTAEGLCQLQVVGKEGIQSSRSIASQILVEQRTPVPRQDDRMLVRLAFDQYSVPHTFAVMDIMSCEIDWNGIVFDDGETLTLSAGGRIIDGPEDIDRYVVHSVRYAGGRTIPVTRSELMERVAKPNDQKAMQWVIDHGARVRFRDQDQYVVTTDETTLSAAATVTAVDLSGCQELSSDELTHLSEFSDLQALNLANTSLTRFPTVGGLSQLRSLNLKGVPLTSAAGVESCQGLEELDISDTQIDSKSASVILGLKQLKRLNLSNTNIDRFTLQELATLKNLQELYLAGVKVSATDIAALQQALPSCNVDTQPQQ